MKYRKAVFPYGPLLVTTLVILGMGGPLHAQSTRSVSFQRFSKEQGLSNYSIRSLLQDRSGFLWIGTQAGLNRYDGYRFKPYQPGNANLYINVLYEDHLGMIWIGTRDSSAYVFDPEMERFTQYAHDPRDPGSLSHHDVRAIFEDQSGTIWIGTNGGGLNRFDRDTGRFTHFRSLPGEPFSLASDTIRAIHEAPPGMLLIGTERGLDRLDLRTEQVTPYTQDADEAANSIRNAVLSIYVDRVGSLWVGTLNEGLYALHRDAETFDQYLHDPGDPRSLSGNYVRTIYEDRDGVLWIGTDKGGLNRFDRVTEGFTRFRYAPENPQSLPHNEVHAILMDRSGTLWVGTWGGLGKHIPTSDGAALVRAHFTHQPDQPNSLSHAKVKSIFEDRSGVLWIGTLGGGLNRLDRKTNRITHIPLPFADVMTICEDRFGVLWIGTRDNNLYLFDRVTEQVTPYRLESGEGHPDDIVLTIYEAPSEPGVLWVGTRRDGLFAFDAQSRRVIGHYLNDPADASSLSHNYAWPIFEDQSGVLWIGTIGGGLNRFDRASESFTSYRHDESDPTSISSDAVISLYGDPDGMLWVGTYGGGFNAFDPSTERFVHYNRRHGLPDNDILGILPDNEGSVWLSTNNGVSRFNPQTEAFFNYGVADGLQSTIFHIGAAFGNLQGELFFGGENGFNVLSPSAVQDDVTVPPVVLTDFKLFGESEPLGTSLASIEEIRLPYDENFITFEFAALDFTDPSKNRYKYKLEGLEEMWVAAEDERTARYPALKTGSYTFRVIGSNKNNLWNEVGTSVRIVITPPWWKTWWAYTLYGMILVGSIFGTYKRRVRRLKAHAVTLKRLVEERTRDLRAEKQKTEEQAEKLLELEQVKDRFFANISHEFRTPLTLILGPVQDAMDGMFGPVDDRLRKQLEVMQRSGLRLHGLINQLLDLSKLEVGRMELRAQRHDLVKFIKEIVLSFSSHAERRSVALQYHTLYEHLPVYFDADKLEKVISNLLSNALKFTPKHGKVRVNVLEVMDESGSFVEVRVKDTGQGIPDEELPFIFDRFHQVDTSMTREHEGSGIGLALAKELVELHGGTIDVESESGFGTTFIVRLRKGTDHLRPEEIVEAGEEPPEEDAFDRAIPRATLLTLTADTEKEPPPLDEADAPGDAPTILIVEDNADVREYLKLHLGEFYHLVEAADGVEGLARAKKLRPDLVISDVMMPEMDGVALCRALKKDAALNHIPVILLTAKASEESKLEGLETGADDYICKPFSTEELLVRVENLIEVRRLLRQRFGTEVLVQPSGVAVTPADAAFLERVKDVVEAHLEHSNFGVEWLADEVGLSPRQLQRRLRAMTSLSPAGFVRMMRLQRAAHLLEQQAGSVSEIAYAVGFQDPNYFSRLFRQTFGVPPSEYVTNQT
ncbi:MAG: two-component regulator propeller domain-containing protein [Rhodothermales bacterium]